MLACGEHTLCSFAIEKFFLHGMQKETHWPGYAWHLPHFKGAKPFLQQLSPIPYCTKLQERDFLKNVIMCNIIQIVIHIIHYKIIQMYNNNVYYPFVTHSSSVINLPNPPLAFSPSVLDAREMRNTNIYLYLASFLRSVLDFFPQKNLQPADTTYS